MTRQQARKYLEKAEKKRSNGDYVAAGEYYSQAAFERAGVGTFVNGSDGSELRCLLHACTCYRVGEAEKWYQNRARMGELLTEELATRAFSKPEPTHTFDKAQRGVWYEFAGDFRTVGGFTDAAAAYEQAKQVYREAGNPTTGSAEQPHMAVLSYFDSVAKAADADIDEIRGSTSNQPLSNWVTYKQDRLPKYLEILDDRGEYPI